MTGLILAANSMVRAAVGTCWLAGWPRKIRFALATVGLTVAIGVVAVVRTRILDRAVKARVTSSTHARAILAVAMARASVDACTVLA